MSDSLSSLTQTELVALALEASRRDDAGHALAYLKEAAVRTDASAEALFLLGSEYAQLGMLPEAKAALGRAVDLGQANPATTAQTGGLPIARFQLGLLHLTSGDPAAALQTWGALAELADTHPQAYLKQFHQGMVHLVADEFDAALLCLGQGIASNQENPPLNADMTKVIDAIHHLPGRQATDPVPSEPLDPLAAAQAQAVHAALAGRQEEGQETPSPAAEPAGEEQEPSHLFISAYTHRGKPH